MLSLRFLAAVAKIHVPVEKTEEPDSDVDRKVERQAVKTDAENLCPEPLPSEVADDREAGQEIQGRERDERVPGDLPGRGRGEDGPGACRYEERDDGRPALVQSEIQAWADALVQQSVDILLESTPASVPLGSVRAQLAAIPGIESVHDLHVWSVTSNVVAMSVHAIVRDPERHQHVLEHVHDAMQLFGISHVTVQLERREMYERESHLHP